MYNIIRLLKKTKSIFNNKKGAGFTILELMVAIVVISIGVLSAYSVVQQIFADTFIASSRLTAAYLAQEGIEIVRNIRDTNWLKSDPWNSGLEAGDYEVDWNDAILTPDSDRFLDFFLNKYFYESTSSHNTKFKRKITIFDETADMFKVRVEVLWTEKGKNYTITVQENLYDWKNL